MSGIRGHAAACTPHSYPRSGRAAPTTCSATEPPRSIARWSSLGLSVVLGHPAGPARKPSRDLARTSVTLHSLGDRGFCRSELVGRAELDEIRPFFGFGSVSR